jgi:hypothetical protein
MRRGVFIDPMVPLGNGVQCAGDPRVAPYTRGEPSAAYLLATAAECAAEARAYRVQMMDAPGSRVHVSAAARAAGVTPAVMDALAAAYAEHIPLWLATHLYRNGIAFAAFVFELVDERGGGAVAALRAFAADMRALCTQAAPPFGALERTLHRLRADGSEKRAPAAAAAGPLPEQYRFVFVLTAPGGAGEARAWRDVQLVHWSFNIRLRTPELARLVEWQERHFLAPPDAPLPYEITLCAYDAAAHAATLPRAVRLMFAMGQLQMQPCAVCGGSWKTCLYYADSPTWRGLKRAARELPPLPAASPMANIRWAECRCGGCEQCGARGGSFKRCGGCNLVQYCGKECQRAHWAEHKAACKRLAALKK